MRALVSEAATQAEAEGRDWLAQVHIYDIL
jgi:hypothetical protein